jgi:hypothetical protein
MTRANALTQKDINAESRVLQFANAELSASAVNP